jgi:hypothetical protein
VAIGEAIGFAIPALMAAAGVALGAPEWMLIALSILGGAGEGAVLGYAQATATETALPGLRVRGWVIATACGAFIAWVFGWTTPVVAEKFPELSPGVMALVAVIAGLGVLVSLSGAQWLVLRRLVSRAWWWIPGNAAAWAVAVPVVFIAMGLVPNDAPAGAFAVAGLLSGLVMALIAAVGTGWVMVRILEAQRP